MKVYEETGGFTIEALELDRKTHDIVDEIIREYIQNGVEPEFIEYIMKNAIHKQVLRCGLEKQLNKRRKNAT